MRRVGEEHVLRNLEDARLPEDPGILTAARKHSTAPVAILESHR